MNEAVIIVNAPLIQKDGSFIHSIHLSSEIKV